MRLLACLLLSGCATVEPATREPLTCPEACADRYNSCTRRERKRASRRETSEHLRAAFSRDRARETRGPDYGVCRDKYEVCRDVCQ